MNNILFLYCFWDLRKQIFIFSPPSGKMYSIQNYAIKFVSDRSMVFSWYSDKTDRNDITEILLKVALKTITLALYFFSYVSTDQQYCSVLTLLPWY